MGKSEHHHEILRIRVSLGSKIELKLTILIFLTKFVKKENFQSKKEKLHLRAFMVVTYYIEIFRTGG